jgi:hypothetical protein
MRFILFICAEPDLQLSPEDKEALPGAVEAWATDLADRGIRLMGHVFEPIKDAKTIRRRSDDLQVTDGPVANRSRVSTCLSARRLMRLSRSRRGIRWPSTARSSYELSLRESARSRLPQ